MNPSLSVKSRSKDFIQWFVNLRNDVRKSLDLQFPDKQNSDLPVRLLKWIFTDYNALILLGGFLCFLVLLVIIVAIYIKELQKNEKNNSTEKASKANKSMANTNKQVDKKNKKE